jgi:spermidine synthase
MAVWFEENNNDVVKLSFRVERQLFHGKSAFQEVEVIETAAFGRMLTIDGLVMTTERDEFIYHEMLTHPVMTTAPNIRRVLVIGGGDGGTVREVLRHPEVESVVMVEIDGMVVDACKAHLPTIGTAWDDPRLDLRIGDGIAHVAEVAPQSYDVILLDGSDPVGPAEGLFNEAFLEHCRRALTPGGVFSMQSESTWFLEDVFYETQGVLSKVFGRADPYLTSVPTYMGGIWTWTYASETTRPDAIIESRVDRIEPGCRYYNRDVHHGAFALPNYVRRRLATHRS